MQSVYKRVLILLLFLATISLFVMVGTTSVSAARNEMPDADKVLGPNPEATFITLAQYGSNPVNFNFVALDAPIVWSRLVYPGDETNFVASVFDGCMAGSFINSSNPDEGYADNFCALGGNVNNPAYFAHQVDFYFCISGNDGNRLFTSVDQMIGQLGANCFRRSQESMFKNAWAQFNIPLNPPLTQASRTKSIIVAATFRYYAGTSTQGGPRDARGNGRSNAFKIRVDNANGVASYVSGANTGEPTAIQNRFRRSDPENYNNNYVFPFAIPCVPGETPSLKLRWQDADAGGYSGPEGAIPYDLNVRFVLYNATTGESVTSEDLAARKGFRHADFIGGNTVIRDFTFTTADFPIELVQGHLYEWRWESIQQNNGVQFWTPFDTAEFYNPSECFNRVSCRVEHPSTIYSGEDFVVRFIINNNTGQTLLRSKGWRIGANLATRDESGTNNYLASNFDQWVRADWRDSGIRNRSSDSFEVVFKAKNRGSPTGEFNPATSSYGANLNGGQYNFEWRLIKENQGWYGEKCGSVISVSAGNVSCKVLVLNEVLAGQPFDVEFTFTNNDNAELPLVDGWAIGANSPERDGASTNNYLAPKYEQYARVKPTISSFPASSSYSWRVTFQAKKRLDNPFEFNPSAVPPSYSSSNLTSRDTPYEFDWRVVRAATGGGWYGDVCQNDFYVKAPPPSCAVPSVVSGVTNLPIVSVGEQVSLTLRVVVPANSYTEFQGEVDVEGSTPVIDDLIVVFRPEGNEAGSDTENFVAIVPVDGFLIFNSVGEFEVEFEIKIYDRVIECREELKIAKKPYFSVYSNDIGVGRAFETEEACKTSQPFGENPPTVKAFSKLDNDKLVGSSSEFAVIAPGVLNTYSMFTGNRRLNNTNPSNYTFSNTIGSNWGGNFFASTPCMTDYFSQNQDNPSILTPSESTSNKTDKVALRYKIRDKEKQFIINTSDAGENVVARLDFRDILKKRTAVFVYGDVLLTENINLRDLVADEEEGVDEIAYLNIIVKGDIYIDKDVTRIDGVLIAQPVSGKNKGRIITCVDYDSDSRVVKSIKANELGEECNKKLTINGAIAAKRVHLLRTNGSISQATPNANQDDPYSAEIIDFNSWVYAGLPKFPKRSEAGQVDSFSNLPPIF